MGGQEYMFFSTEKIKGKGREGETAEPTDR